MQKKYEQAGRSGWRGGSCASLLHGVCEFGVTGELLADPGTLVAEVIMIVIMISMVYFVYYTNNTHWGQLQNSASQHWHKSKKFREVVGYSQCAGAELTGVGFPPPGLVTYQ